jgi:hypothetical protein
MNSGEIALIISGASLAISLCGFIWNIWSKFIFVRPDLQVTFAVVRIFAGGHPKHHICALSVTNLGPGPTIIHSCVVVLRNEKRFGRRQHAILNPIHGDPTAAKPISKGPFSAGLPLKMDVAEVRLFHFPFTAETFLKDRDLLRVGVNDTFGRNVWCRRRDVRRAREKWENAFGNIKSEAV